MSTDLLREAAATLRTRADEATPETWAADSGGDVRSDRYVVVAFAGVGHLGDPTYIALMHPPVARAVADWLTFEAGTCEIAGKNRQTQHAVAVARAVLRRYE